MLRLRPEYFNPFLRFPRIVNDYGALFLVDAVTSLTGCELDIDAMSIDICYSGSQKCLNCLPGSNQFGDRALDLVRNKKTKVQS
jgi:alanine-glyoxylate transaminase/serine-glyoxylate transaminase/serine-pyruvate transaminase